MLSCAFDLRSTQAKLAAVKKQLVCTVACALYLGACSSPYQRPDVTVQILPKGAQGLTLPPSPLTAGEMNFVRIVSARVKRAPSGILQVRVEGEEYFLQTDLSGSLSKVIVPNTMCFDVDLSAKTSSVTGYRVYQGGASTTGSLAGCADFGPAPDAGVLPLALAATNTLADMAAAERFNFGLLAFGSALDVPAIGGKMAVFASVAATQDLSSPFSDVTGPREVLNRSLVVRGTFENGKPSQLAVALSPDSLPMISSVSVSGSDYFWHSRDERIYRVSNSSVPLALQYLGVGAANLYRDQVTKTALGSTMASLLEGDQWTGVFQTTRGETTRISVRTTNAASSTFEKFQPFTPLTVVAPNPRAMSVCFSEQLEPSSVLASSFRFLPLVPVTDITLSSSKMCVAVTTAARENRPYAVLVSEVRSVFGSSLPPGGVTLTLNAKRNGVIDFLYELFAGFDSQSLIHIAPTSSGGVVGLVTGSQTAMVWRAANGLSFAQPVETTAGRFIRDADDALGHGLWVVKGPDGAGVSRVSHYDDGPVERVEVTGSVYDLLPIGDGSAIIRTESKPDSRIVQGMPVALPLELQSRVTGHVRGSSDVLVTAGRTTERRRLDDGSLVTTYPLAGVKLVVEPYLCAFNPYLAERDGGVTAISPELSLNCSDLVRAPSGQVVMTASPGSLAQLYRLSGATAALVPVQVTSQADLPYVSQPRFTAQGVYFYEETVNVPTRKSLAFATAAQWQALTDGGLQ